jgi:uncharacterized membrane protein
MHFISPQFFLNIMPPFIPFHLEIVYISGVAEIIIGAMLFVNNYKVIAAWLAIALFVAVFPANIYNAYDWYQQEHQYFIGSLVRLPIQFFLIWWAYQYTKKD